jgi:hypothetical protein
VIAVLSLSWTEWTDTILTINRKSPVIVIMLALMLAPAEEMTATAD